MVVGRLIYTARDRDVVVCEAIKGMIQNLKTKMVL